MSLEELLRACIEGGDESVWREFVRRFHPLIAGVVARMTQRRGDSSPALIDDLIQETYLKLCTDRARLLREFEARHEDSFYSYLKVVTANIVHDHYRLMHSVKRGSGQEDSLEASDAQPVSSGLGTPKEMEKAVLMTEINLVLAHSVAEDDKERDCTVFWLYYRQGLTAQAIAQLPGISLSVKGVESLLHRLTRIVRERLSQRKNFVAAS